MYGDLAESSARVAPVSKLGEADSRPAIEVIEMANGETVWLVGMHISRFASMY
jgi:hypothetical protein